MDDLARANDMERRFAERLSTRTQPFDFGVGYFDTEYPERFVSNFLDVHSGLDHADAVVLLGEADGILGGAGCPHRTVVVRSDALGDRIAPTFAANGYRVEREVISVHRRAPDRDADLVAEELSFGQARPVILETYRRNDRLPGDVAQRFADQHGKYERVLGTRFFGCRIDGALAGVCELWMDGSDAMVEDVDTLEEYRGRGVARSVVLRAVQEARAAGAERVFIFADDDDWPKELYARLGFDPLGRIWMFICPPAEASGPGAGARQTGGNRWTG
jgi:GNAT superfamily N-acetyltransferase